MTPILQVKNLQTHFFTKAGVLKAVDGVSFEIGAGKLLALWGIRVWKIDYRLFNSGAC